jgi:hypothetical protein
VLQVVAFFLVTALCAQALSYLTAQTYVPSATPNKQFPVVAVLRSEPTSTKVQYQRLRWCRWTSPVTPKQSLERQAFETATVSALFGISTSGA